MFYCTFGSLHPGVVKIPKIKINNSDWYVSMIYILKYHTYSLKYTKLNPKSHILWNVENYMSVYTNICINIHSCKYSKYTCVYMYILYTYKYMCRYTYKHMYIYLHVYLNFKINYHM